MATDHTRNVEPSPPAGGLEHKGLKQN